MRHGPEAWDYAAEALDWAECACDATIDYHCQPTPWYFHSQIASIQLKAAVKNFPACVKEACSF